MEINSPIFSSSDQRQEHWTALPIPTSGPNHTLPSLSEMLSSPPLLPDTLASRSIHGSTAHSPWPLYGFATAPGLERRGSESVATDSHSKTNSPTTSYSSLGTILSAHPKAPYTSIPGLSTSSHLYAAPAAIPSRVSPSCDSIRAALERATDDKRRRNASASKRFRQRRKEKERESSQIISRLESEMYKAIKERDYYRNERDYLRAIVNGNVPVTPRIPSPRCGGTSVAASNGNPETNVWQQNGERDDDGAVNHKMGRRRLV